MLYLRVGNELLLGEGGKLMAQVLDCERIQAALPQVWFRTNQMA